MSPETQQIILLCLAAFAAGFVDAIVGGGGLIQTPAALVILGTYPVSSVLATVKIPSFTGTAFAVVQYVKRVRSGGGCWHPCAPPHFFRRIPDRSYYYI
jgi:uncharacterized membrane protein YfcA